jgi:hypothetical protein
MEEIEKRNQEFNATVASLIDAVQKPTKESLEKNKEAIIQFGERCKKSGLYVHADKKSKAFFKDKTDPAELWIIMLHKIVKAPVKLMADGVVILYMPAIADLLQVKEETGKTGEKKTNET